ncbi:DUF4395 domain-containing protein [Hoyosella sp. G463]|uniref:DUF4395 domain-containing protein n=1 Tax=Lolliginicoccus lacisalsi TaxID=2742202 RepID=A0A927JB60_9ACTN|nr:DUF4395 domain-containing protein [Lolliginicoccus lacisalsi]MBD8505861.1 DUF4395 domain-containing protein [Lolliginicoccus lacisalsi]
MALTQTTPGIDVRGPRFSAWITTAVLAIVLATNWWPLLAAQAIIFGIGATRGPRHTPSGMLFGRIVAPRLGPVTEREPAAPVQFAQFVGLVFAAAGLIAYLAGAVLAAQVLVGFAFAAAFLNAAFGICLGCQIYPLAARLAPTGRGTAA